ncbi:MAG: hypothetical protein JF606_09620 [Burkholderiales bacterium]|nr:hypothetical protein [Burkholderiales bacterium]
MFVMMVIVAISAAFPLFLIARQRRIKKPG